jgi:predicted metal-binding transcription factor (methanogenesis marker protein 9)
MNSNLKQYLDFIEDWEHIQTETYLVLLRNAALKKAEARKRIEENGEDVDEAMKSARKYMRIMDYLYERWERERKRREYGNA